MMMRTITTPITRIAPTALPATMEIEEPPAQVDFGGEERVNEEVVVGTRMVVKRMT